jgi:ribosome maturation factor RimP
MKNTERIRLLLEELFSEGPLSDCFVIDVVQSSPRTLTIFFDSDSGVTFEKCTQVSRFLEKRIDEAHLLEENYVLDVSSPGVDRPLMLWRQYPRHQGRYLRVSRKDGSAVEGKLERVDLEDIILHPDDDEAVTIPFSEIEKSFVLIRF